VAQNVYFHFYVKGVDAPCLKLINADSLGQMVVAAMWREYDFCQQINWDVTPFSQVEVHRRFLPSLQE
jgi:hypothetical protein